MKNNNLFIWIVIILIILIILISIFFSISKKTGFLQKTGKGHQGLLLTSLTITSSSTISFISKGIMYSDDYDVLMHASAYKQNLPSLLENQSCNIEFISYTDLDTADSYYNSSISDKQSVNSTEVLNNDYKFVHKSQLLQGYSELRHMNNYSAVSLKVGIPTEHGYYIKGENTTCYIRKYKKYSSEVFYYIQIKIEEDTQAISTKNYQLLTNILEYITTKFKNNYIIIGSFNVQGYQKVLERYFSSTDNIICDLNSTFTRNNDFGLVNFDGLVVSKNLYKRIDFNIEFFPGDNNNAFVIYFYLYFSGNGEINDITTKKMKNYQTYLTKNIKRTVYVNNTGSYNKSTVANTSGFTLVPLNKLDSNDVGAKIYKYSTLTDKLDTIELL